MYVRGYALNLKRWWVEKIIKREEIAGVVRVVRSVRTGHGFIEGGTGL
jgi:hypothetical protein